MKIKCPIKVQGICLVGGQQEVAVTQILWRPRGLLVDQFDSKEDLINAVFTSSFIPGYLAPRPATLFRNRLCIDGGLTLFMPQHPLLRRLGTLVFELLDLNDLIAYLLQVLWDTTEEGLMFMETLVRVCAFPAGRLGLDGIGISPDCNPENRATPRELLNWALEPAEDYILDRLFELGYLDAAVWAEDNPVEELVQEDTVPKKLKMSLHSSSARRPLIQFMVEDGWHYGLSTILDPIVLL
ncbi:hypothetical protein CK203_045416 [Vitis vinifera]|uniref:PNPLA domain-containing protein n=1 Tax=Vitis vinifera TaxID=29760 RepID=A0A438H966_VITVI|nr:hypothetical protein CK203_045416 [Vitis vinifera]